jgi:hypothetical protein
MLKAYSSELERLVKGRIQSQRKVSCCWKQFVINDIGIRYFLVAFDDSWASGICEQQNRVIATDFRKLLICDGKDDNILKIKWVSGMQLNVLPLLELLDNVVSMIPFSKTATQYCRIKTYIYSVM